MKWSLFAAAAILAAMSWLPSQAAEPAARSDPETITFEQYRDWRLPFIEQRQGQIAAQLAAAGLGAPQRERLDRQKAYYDTQAAMPSAERDRRFRERFDRIDANHDGKIDRGERSVWHDKQRAYYHRQAAAADAPRR